MVKIALQIKANLESIEELYTNHEDYSYTLKMKCTGCAEVSEKWHDICESEKIPSKTGRSEHNFIMKCKLCSRENSLDIIPGTKDKYTIKDNGKFKSILAFDCRGIELVDFLPSEGWVAKAEGSGTIFEKIDLSEKEWADFDEKTKQPVGIYEMESQFVVVK